MSAVNTKKSKEDEIPDSDLTPEFIQFTEQRQKKTIEKTKTSQETIPDPN